MSRRARILVIVAGLVVLAAVVAALGYAFTRDDGPHKPRYPGRIAVREGCGLRHMFFDASDQKVMCLQNVFDTVSVSRNGDKLAWDTKGGNAIIVSGVDGTSPVNVPVPLGANSAPSLSPDGTKIAFLHSPRNDGNYDIWVTSTTASDAEQETNTRNVSDVVWSPTGDWLAYVQNWSERDARGPDLARPSERRRRAHAPPGRLAGLVARREASRLRPQRLDLDGRLRRHRRAPADPERPLTGLVARRRR